MNRSHALLQAGVGLWQNSRLRLEIGSSMTWPGQGCEQRLADCR